MIRFILFCILFHLFISTCSTVYKIGMIEITVTIHFNSHGSIAEVLSYLQTVVSSRVGMTVSKIQRGAGLEVLGH